MHGLVYVDDLCVCVCVCVDAASQRDLNFHVMLLLLLYACTTTWRVSFMSTAASQLLASPVSSPTSTTHNHGAPLPLGPPRGSAHPRRAGARNLLLVRLVRR